MNMEFIKRYLKSEKGFTLVELIVGAGLLSIISLGVAYSSIVSLHAHKITEIKSATSLLSENKLEELNLVPVSNLDDTYDDSETGLTVANVSNITFNRVTNVTVNADNSRTISIITTSTNGLFSGSTNLQTTVAQW